MNRRKAGRFMFSNLGGLLAFAAIVFDAGGIREKVNVLTSAQAETNIVVKHISATVQKVETDVAVLKHKTGLQ
jgi:hypothetical protein